MSSTLESARSTRWHGFLGAGVVAALLSSAACALIWLVARALGASLLVPDPPPAGTPQPLPLPAVIASCVAPALLATLAFAALSRLTRRPLEVLLGVGLLLLLASLVLLWLLETDLPTKGVLALMHVLAFLLILGPLVGMVEPSAPA